MTILIVIHLLMLVLLTTLTCLVLLRLKSERKNFFLVFLFGSILLVLGGMLQLLATTVEGAVFATMILFFGLAISIPSILVFIQQYCQQPMPTVIHILNYMISFSFMLIIWIPQLRPLIYETIFIYPEGMATSVYAWGITRGLLYPVWRIHSVVVAIVLVTILIKTIWYAPKAQKRRKFIWICVSIIFVAFNGMTFWVPHLLEYMLIYNVVLVMIFSVLAYWSGFFSQELTENEEVVQIQNTINEMIASISHDLKTPLTILSVSIEKLLLNSPDDPNYIRDVQIAYNKNLDLQRLIQNLIDVTRMETVSNMYKPEWLTLSDFLLGIQEKYNDYVESTGLSFDVNISGGDALIFLDPTKIWSAFDNAIYNSARHTKTGGITITARTQSEDDTATITITDTGCGIPPEHIPNIFERFYKVDKSPKSGEIGLGLYIIKSIMSSLGGKAEIESEEGIGTSVILTFLKQQI
ncbi:MAG: ATP-binding protein [Defluviitaleaceae bacterium]|nr:ATP-binding protein [Defluviitaleaceae bacterium]